MLVVVKWGVGFVRSILRCRRGSLGHRLRLARVIASLSCLRAPACPVHATCILRYREIRGKKNVLLFVVAAVLNITSVVLLALAKSEE